MTNERKTPEQIVAAVIEEHWKGYAHGVLPEGAFEAAIVADLRAAGLLVQEPDKDAVERAARAFYEEPAGFTSWDRLNKVEPGIADRYRAAVRRALAAAGVALWEPSEIVDDAADEQDDPCLHMPATRVYREVENA